jgi:hypothetical protein
MWQHCIQLHICHSLLLAKDENRNHKFFRRFDEYWVETKFESLARMLRLRVSLIGISKMEIDQNLK